MSTRINTNVTAYEAARNLNINSDNLGKNIQRLSSGLRINSAADDAAGLVISQNFKAQITGLNQATRNSNDAINEVKTAEGALNEVHSLLISIRQLAVHASNLGANSTVDVQADQTQIASAIASVNRIASATSFGNKKLLDGSATSANTTTAGSAVGVGLNVVSQGTYNASTAGTYDTVSITAATAASEHYSFKLAGSAGTYLTAGNSGNYAGSIAINGTSYNLGTVTSSNLTQLNLAIAASGYQASIAANGELTFTNQNPGVLSGAPVIDLSSLAIGTNSLTTVTGSGSSVAAVNSVITLDSATNFNNTIGTNTVTAPSVLTYTFNGQARSVTVTSGSMSAGSFGADFNLTVVGNNLVATATGGGAATITSLGGMAFTDAGAGIAAPTISQTTAGNPAYYNFAIPAGATTTLTAATARFSGVLTAQGGGGLSNTFTIGPNTSLTNLNSTLSAVGVTASVAANGDLHFSSVGNATAPTITLGTGFTAYANLTSNTGTFTNGSDESMALSNASNTLTSSSTQTVGSTNYYTFNNGLVISSTASPGTITGVLNATAGVTTTGQDLEFQVGANGGQTTKISIGSVAASQLGKGAAAYVDSNGTTQQVATDSIADLNVLTFKGAQDAVAVIDKAISDISSFRATLGAFQSNVLESNVRSLGISQQNLSASLSTIVDTDLSSEIVEYTKNQILVQAGTNALGQANQAPQAILSLLKG